MTEARGSVMSDDPTWKTQASLGLRVPSRVSATLLSAAELAKR
jgi:hypothetical protein